MQKLITLLFISIFLVGCGANKNKNEYPAIDVVGYIRGQLRILDSIPYGILKISEYPDGKSDSVFIKKELLADILKPYLNESISKAALEKDYMEKSFADAGAKTINITYDSKDKEAEIHQIVIYIEPSNGSIHLLYITGFFETRNGLEKKQLLWMHNKGFQIISSAGMEENNSVSVTEKYIWQ